tara:strand:- start:386 stop:565 length:180 start_codon:yes stop_codon:yes gene_type:complete
MSIETNGWGESSVATKYVYERLHHVLDNRDMAFELSRFLDELAHNYKVDTGRLIGEEVE